MLYFGPGKHARPYLQCFPRYRAILMAAISLFPILKIYRTLIKTSLEVYLNFENEINKYNMEVYKSKSAIPSLKSGSIKGIQGTLGGNSNNDSDINSDINKDISGFITPID
jgi:hypothetical protein